MSILAAFKQFGNIFLTSLVQLLYYSKASSNHVQYWMMSEEDMNSLSKPAEFAAGFYFVHETMLTSNFATPTMFVTEGW